MQPETATGETTETTPPTTIAQGDDDHLLERHAARVNGHDLSRCEGYEGPLTPEERRDGVSEWYTFWACENCGRETTTPPHRWETIPCEPGVCR